MTLLENIVTALTEIEKVDLEKMKLFSTPKYNNMMFGYLQKAAQMGALDKPSAEKIFNSIQDRLVKLQYEKPALKGKMQLPKITNIKNMPPKKIIDMSQQYFNKLFDLDRYGASKVKQQVMPTIEKLPDEVEPEQIQAPDLPKKSWEEYLASQHGISTDKMRAAKRKDTELKKKLATHPPLPKDTKSKTPPALPPTEVTPDMMMPPDLPKKPSLQKEPPPMPADRNAPGQQMKKALSNIEKGQKSGIKKKRTYKVTDKDIVGKAEGVKKDDVDKALSEMIFKFFQEEVL